jgi:glycosyltransferase involved in cell wall biosynthesis
MTYRVAIVTQDLSHAGGVGTMTEFLYRVLADSGRYQPEIISLATSASDHLSVHVRRPRTWLRGIQVREATWRQLRYLHVGAMLSEFESQRYRPRKLLTKLLRDFDLIHFVVGSPPYACVATKVASPVFLWTATTTRADRASQMRNGSLARRIWSLLMVPITEQYERRALKFVDRVFALSVYTRSAVESIERAQKAVLAPCGVDLDLFRPTTHPKGKYIVCVARLFDPRKNVRLLLDAYAKLHNKAGMLPDLYLIGDPPSAKALLHLKDLGIAHKVKLIGPKYGEELAELYRNALFFVLSSNEEGLGIVILEAMASGLAVVSTACGGPATAVVQGETGLLTPIGDAFALADAMETLLRDSALRSQMGSQGRKIAQERFSIAKAGKVFLDRYDKVFSDREKQPEQESSRKRSFSTLPAAES